MMFKLVLTQQLGLAPVRILSVQRYNMSCQIFLQWKIKIPLFFNEFNTADNSFMCISKTKVTSNVVRSGQTVIKLAINNE